jgi:hypothetical protein
MIALTKATRSAQVSFFADDVKDLIEILFSARTTASSDRAHGCNAERCPDDRR